ncbi:MAG TPA: MMPL family transporter [Sphingomonadaceae bacterium]|nr:MMPL family transporter [Sphingomonadaceae bacterium]
MRDSLPGRAVAWSCGHPVLILLAAALLTLGAGLFSARHFAMNTDTSALIAADVPWRQGEQRFDAAFPGKGDIILAVIDGATPELAERAAADLSARLAADPAHFKRIERPDGGPFFATHGLLFASTGEVRDTTARMIEAQPFLGPLAADPSLRGVATALSTMLEGIGQGRATLDAIDPPIGALADALDARAAGKPAFFSWQRLFAGSGGALQPPLRRLILIEPVLDYGALMPGAAASDAIRAEAEALRLDAAHGVSVRLTGSVPLSDEEFASLADKAWLVGGAMLAAMLLTLWLATRSIRIVGAIMATTLSGLAITAAIGLAAVGEFNLISVAFIPLFVGLGVDFGIQISVRFRAERRVHDDDIAALAAAASALGPALSLAAAAICLGFFAFLPTDYVGISELGVIAGLGMVVAFALNVTLLPALLVLLRTGRPRAEAGTPALAPVDRFLVERRRLVLGVFAASMIVSIALLPLVRFDFNPLHLRDTNGEAMATLTELMRDPDRSPNTLDVLAPSLTAAHALADRLRVLPEVRQAITLDSFVPGDQAPKLAAISDAQLLLDLTLDPFDVAPPPDDAALVASLERVAAALRATAATGSPKTARDARRLAEAFAALARARPADRAAAQAMIVAPLEVMLDQMRASLQAQPITRANLPPALVRDWIAPDGRARIQLFPAGAADDNATLVRFVDAVRTIAPDATGPPVSTREAARTIARAFILAGLLALAAISLLLLAVLRSLREVAFTLAPVILSGFLTLGTCVLIGQAINFANIIAFPLLFGVGVAFHIYFVMAWRAGATDLLQSSLARAVFFSALATGTAFGSLWLSSHPGTASMGKILMLSLAWTLICALVFEPALLGPQKPGRKPLSAP